MLFTNNIISAQIPAITKDGKTVVLFDNGIKQGKTWEYADTLLNTPISKGGEYFKPLITNCIIKGQDVKYVLLFDSTEWNIDDTAINSAADFSLNLKSSELTLALLIPEKQKTTLENLKDVALENAKRVGKNIIITKQEYRKVNKKDMLYLEFTTEIQGYTFLFMANYYAGQESCIQLVAYTEINNIIKDKPKMQDLLNGLVVP